MYVSQWCVHCVVKKRHPKQPLNPKLSQTLIEAGLDWVTLVNMFCRLLLRSVRAAHHLDGVWNEND